MSEPENFLSRWARRKREIAESRDSPEAPGEPAAAPQTAEPAAMPEIDLSALPPIETITSATDIRAFLAPGVPAELTRAALRRAWVVDPAIRDFIGMAENQWDFTAPEAMPGFGPLHPLDDVKKMLARVFGEMAPEPPQSIKAGSNEPPQQIEQGLRQAEEIAPADSSIVVENSTIVVGRPHEIPTIRSPVDVAVQDERRDTATQHQDTKQQTSDHFVRRRHGGALPQ
jgi:hypothetical protein